MIGSSSTPSAMDTSEQQADAPHEDTVGRFEMAIINIDFNPTGTSVNDLSLQLGLTEQAELPAIDEIDPDPSLQQFLTRHHDVRIQWNNYPDIGLHRMFASSRKFVETLEFLHYTDELEHDVFAELYRGNQYAHVSVITSLQTYSFIQSYLTKTSVPVDDEVIESYYVEYSSESENGHPVRTMEMSNYRNRNSVTLKNVMEIPEMPEEFIVREESKNPLTGEFRYKNPELVDRMKSRVVWACICAIRMGRKMDLAAFTQNITSFRSARQFMSTAFSKMLNNSSRTTFFRHPARYIPILDRAGYVAMLNCNSELIKLPDLANLTSDSAHSTELIGTVPIWNVAILHFICSQPEEYLGVDTGCNNLVSIVINGSSSSFEVLCSCVI